MAAATKPWARTPLATAGRAGAVVAALALGSMAACQANCGAADSAANSAAPGADANLPPAPLRASGTQSGAPGAPDVALGSAPIRNPLNLYDIGLSGVPDAETVGAVDGVAITMADLQAQSVGAFTRIAERLYRARDNGYRWLLERVALNKQAALARKPLIPFLLAEYDQLPQPSAAELDDIATDVQLRDMSADERRYAATSLWRLQAWQTRRREIVRAGRARSQFERIRQQISSPAYARPDTVVARLDGQPITRAQLGSLAGYQAALARHEYWRIAKLQFATYVSKFLLEREADHLGITVEALKQRELERTAAATDAEIRAYIAQNPAYQSDPKGYERAADNLRRMRANTAADALEQRLRETAEIRFFAREPRFERIPVEVPAPRWHGPAGAERVIVSFHGLGCATCTRGARLLLAILAARPGRFKLLAGDYFEPGQLGAYRGALALHCAPPDRRDSLFNTLAFNFGDGQIDSLTRKAQAADIDPERFRDCLLADRFAPLIGENLAMARRLGLERNVPGLFANGVRISDLDDVNQVLKQLDRAFAEVQPSDNRLSEP